MEVTLHFRRKVMADSLYMVLPGSASLQTFPDNRPGLYRIRSPEIMHVQGYLKVGLVNLIFPATFVLPTIDRLTIMVSFGNIETTYGLFNITVKSIEGVGDMFDVIQSTLGKKSHQTWTKPVRSHQHPFFAEGYTLDGSDQNLSWKYSGLKRVLGAETGSTDRQQQRSSGLL